MLLVFVGSGLFCAFSGGAILAEGPHGPHGEITSDPNAGRWLAPRAGFSLAVVGLGLALILVPKRR